MQRFQNTSRRLGVLGTGACAIAVALMLSGCGDAGDAPAPSGPAPDQTGSGSVAIAAQGSSRTTTTSSPGGSSALSDQTITFDSTGWVLQPPFYAAGDEPFWKLEILDGWFVFRRSGLPDIESPLVQPSNARGIDLFESPPLQVAVRLQACSMDDGQAGVATVTVSFDGIDYAGCGFAGQAAAVGAELAVVADALGAIDACLERLDEPALVTGVYAREGGRTALGLRTRVGSLYECAVEADDMTVAFLDPIEQRAATAWMTSGMRFLRAGFAPEGRCQGAEEVRGPGGVIGLALPESCRF